VYGVVIVAALVGSMAQATARADTLPTIASGGGPSHGWVAIKFTNTAGAQGAVTVQNSEVAGAGFVSAYLYDATNRPVAGGNVGVTGAMGDVHMQAALPPAPGAEQTVVTSHSAQYGGGVTITFDSLLPPGTYKALLIAGGNARGWSWALRGNASVSAPTASITGSDVYAYSAKDFSGLASVQGYAGAFNVPSAGAALNVATQRAITAAHSLVGIGFFAPGTTIHSDMTMDGPGGSRTCPCSLGAVTGSDAAGPGSYSFRYTGVGAGPSNFADFVLGVADAYLPA